VVVSGGEDVLTVCWAAKGGSGTTVVSCALALINAQRRDAWLVDVAGDAPAALGIAEPGGPGILDWVASATAAPNALEALGVTAAHDLRVVPRGTATPGVDHPRWAEIGRFLAERSSPTIVDAGTAPVPPGLLAAAQERLLVIRPCYLALRRAAASRLEPTGVVVLHEPGRALRAQDVAYAVHAPVVAEISLDPAIARAVDAGLLAARLPRPLFSSLRELAA
jgi:hypothetical protein